MDHTTLLSLLPPTSPIPLLGQHLHESLCHFLRIGAQEVPYQERLS